MPLAADHLFALPVAIPIAVAAKLVELLQSPLLSPTLTAALLFALTKAPDQIRVPLVTHLRQYVGDSALGHGVTALKVVLGLGLVKQVNKFLSELAQNNFRLRSQAHAYDWPNEIAVVTGAAGGIGGVLVTDLTAKGVRVIAVDIANELPASLRGNSLVTYYRCDLTDRAKVLELAAKVQTEHGHPSILINNAGVAYQHTTLQVTEAALHRVLDVNLVAHWWTLQAFLPAMLERRKGHIVTTASMASFVGTPSLGPYSASKVAVLALHETLSQELRRVHRVPEICTTIVHPTFVRTPMTSSATKELEAVTSLITPEDVSQGILKNVFAGRGGQVILPGTIGFIPTVMRSMPHWMSYALTRTTEISDAGLGSPGEKKMG